MSIANTSSPNIRSHGEGESSSRDSEGHYVLLRGQLGHVTRRERWTAEKKDTCSFLLINPLRNLIPSSTPQKYYFGIWPKIDANLFGVFNTRNNA